MTDPGDPLQLLRHSAPFEPYPNEPSDAELAAEVGLPEREILRLDMNTLGGGMLSAVAAAAPHAADAVVEYNDLGYVRLRGAIGTAIAAPPSRITPGAGADELIRLITCLVVGPGDAVIVPTPTFGMFAVEARLAGARVVEVPREAPGMRQPVERIREEAVRSSARLVWLCTPNNPTGDAYALDEVVRLADGLEALVVVDEVYVEFAEASADVAAGSLSATQLVDRLPNLVVLRSLSKAYGLAAARVGYLVTADALAARLDATRLPLAVAGPSEVLAVAALGDPDGARRRHGMLVSERERLAGALAALGWESVPSVTNFIATRPPDGAALTKALHRRGIIVRSYAAGVMAGWLRVTVRTRDENDRFLAALTGPDPVGAGILRS